eukprot:RCo047649
MTGAIVLVTGGAGFLGRNIVKLLRLHRANVFAKVRVLDHRPCSAEDFRLPQRDESALAEVETVCGDICDLPTLICACRGVSAVIHCAAIVDFWVHDADELFRVNLQGTTNVISACRSCGVQSLVFTGSMCVVVGPEGVHCGTEQTPYPVDFVYGVYAQTKALAEQAVLQANAGDQGRLRTCVIRALSLFGEEEPWKLHSLLRFTAGGWVTRVGSRSVAHHHAYVGNIAWAHIRAVDRLRVPNSNAAGQVFIPDDDTPVLNFYDFLQPLFECVGYRVIPWPVPYWILYGMACSLELLAWAVRPVWAVSTPLTRTALKITCTSCTFSGAHARKELDYQPLFSYPEALQRTRNYITASYGRRTSSSSSSTSRSPWLALAWASRALSLLRQALLSLLWASSSPSPLRLPSPVERPPTPPAASARLPPAPLQGVGGTSPPPSFRSLTDAQRAAGLPPSPSTGSGSFGASYDSSQESSLPSSPRSDTQTPTDLESPRLPSGFPTSSSSSALQRALAAVAGRGPGGAGLTSKRHQRVLSGASAGPLGVPMLMLPEQAHS